MLFQANQQIGNYTLIKFLGEGGFGEVWLAENHSNPSSEKVAIKLPRKEQIDLQAVKDEIFNWTLSGKHKNILPIIECETFGNQIAIVSEFAPDGSLQDLLKKHRVFSVNDAVEIIVGILDGLAHLHNRKIIHRDLKPDNVLFQGRIPRLTDFGISRALPVGSKSATVSGTLSYMAPEAFDGKRTERTDIWSVGVILYQMLAGNLPFPQQERVELMGAIVMREPNALPDSVPSDLQNIVKKSLEKDSARRYQTADEMKADLKEALKTWEIGKTEPIIDEHNPVPPIDVTLPITIQPTEDWQNISKSQLETEEYQEEQENQFQTTEPSILEENNDTLPFVYSEEVEVTEPYVNFLSSQASNSQVDKTERFEPKLKIPTPVSAKPKSNKLYFAIPAILLLLFSFIGGGLWLSNKASNDKQTITSNTSNKNTPTPIATETPLLDKDVETLLIPFRKGDKFGFSDSNKKLAIEAKYDDAESFSEDIAIVGINKKYGFIDRTGKEVVPIKYRFVSSFSEGLSSVQLNNKNGFIDKSGKVIIPLKFNDSSSFSEGLASVELKGKYGFIDKTGKVIIPFKYDYPLYKFSEGLASVRLNKKDGFIDKTGKEIIPLVYDLAYAFSEGLVSVKLNNKYGFIDKTGKEIIPLKYDSAYSPFSEGLAPVGINNKYGFIDKTDKEIIPFEYDFAFSFSEGLASVELKGKYGFIDKTGKVIIPFKYDATFPFSKGLARVRLNNDKWFYIDRNGTEYYEP